MKLRLKNRFYFRPTRADRVLIIIVSSLFLGIIGGAFSVRWCGDAMRGTLAAYAENVSVPPDVGNVLLNAFFSCFLIYLLVFLFGMSLYGYLFIPVFPFAKGFSYGFTASFICAVFGGRGIVICALGLLPQMLIFSVCIITSGYFAAVRSLALCGSQQIISDKMRTRRYCLTILVFFTISFATVLLDIFITPAVIELFC